MDNRAQVREFLASRRARITPDQAGLPANGGNRRVKGLRREEVALLAGVSIDDVGELSTQSELFRQHWAAHNVTFHRSGRKRLRHPAVGELDLNFEAMELPSEPDLRLNIYTADPHPYGRRTPSRLKAGSAAGRICRYLFR